MKRAKHILLVDDNVVDNFIVEHILKVRNAAELITQKTSAIEALDFLEHQAKEMHRFPDYIFLDVLMPQMDGFRFMSEYAKFPESMKKQCSVIMMTSSEDKKDRERAQNNPLIKNYLLKPLSDYNIEDILK